MLRNSWTSDPSALMARFESLGIISLSVIDQPLSKVATVIQNWLGTSEGRWLFSWNELDFLHVISAGQEYSPHRQKIVAWTPACLPVGTAFLSNEMHGHGPVPVVSKELAANAILLRVSRSPGDEICEFNYLLNGLDRRFVRVMHDGDRWEFFGRGDPLQFEDQVSYQRRRIRDRFTPSMLSLYCDALGFPVGAHAFWTSGNPAFSGEWMTAEEYAGRVARLAARDGEDPR